MAQKLYMPNGSVDAVDLVQIGEMVFCEHVSRLGSSIIKRPEVALRILMEKIQWAMFHAIDQHLVSPPSQSNASTGEQGDDDFAAFNTQMFEAGIPSRKLQRGSTIANETLEDAEQDADLDIAPCACARHLPVEIANDSHKQSNMPSKKHDSCVEHSEMADCSVAR